MRVIKPLVQGLRSSLFQKICNQRLKINGKIYATSSLISCNVTENLVSVFRGDALNVGIQLKLDEASKTARIVIGLYCFEQILQDTTAGNLASDRCELSITAELVEQNQQGSERLAVAAVFANRYFDNIAHGFATKRRYRHTSG